MHYALSQNIEKLLPLPTSVDQTRKNKIKTPFSNGYMVYRLLIANRILFQNSLASGCCSDASLYRTRLDLADGSD